MKKGLCTALLFMLVINGINGLKAEKASALSAETAVVGKVAPTLIKVSAPAKIAFSIDPNIEDPQKRFTSSSIKLVNESNAAVKIKINLGTNNFMLSDDSKWRPVDVLPEEKSWNDIGTNESQSYIALGIKPEEGSWKKVLRSAPLFVAEQNTSNTEIVFGEIERNSDAYMQLICYHGSSFAEGKECSYRIIWSFSIGD